MWKRFVRRLCCPVCKSPLELAAFREVSVEVTAECITLARQRGLDDAEFRQRVEAGLLLCHSCRIRFPILHGLPILLPYRTPLHAEFTEQFQVEVRGQKFSYDFASREPVSGERLVLNSFSKEWLEYDYDGVIWELNYDEHLDRFRKEVGFSSDGSNGADFLEVGCGLGITTSHSQEIFKGDSVGMDLSLASLRAASHFGTNPFLHFVQASVFYLPFPERSFDLIYSRGVLHHTYSTGKAFEAMARCCRPGGRVYLWVYGTGSINETLFRRVAHAGEAMTRPLLSRAPDSWPARAFLSCMGVAYLGFNAAHRLWNPATQPLNFRRAVHAARDRFTPRFAHRHSLDEVMGWFEKAGFQQVEQVNWQIMPAADQEDFRRNVGVRGIRKQ